MTAVVVHAGHRAPLVEAKTLFDAADELELVVPASCRRSGRCHECIVEVTAGGDALAPPGAEEPYVQVLIGPLAGELRPDRWGACIPQVVLGGGAVAAPWTLDRGQAPVGPDTRRLEIGVLERSCASGHSAEGRIAPPTVDYLTDTVVIVIGVVPSRCVIRPSLSPSR